MSKSNVFNTQRRVVMQFEGTAREFRDFLHQISLLVEDDTYEWELTASVARHPAGKGLGRCCLPFETYGAHSRECPLEARPAARWSPSRECRNPDHNGYPDGTFWHHPADAESPCDVR